jgi:hypothetical protein
LLKQCGVLVSDYTASLPAGRSTIRPEQERVRRGEEVGTARLSAEQVLEIRRRYAAGGVTLAALGREFGVSKPTVHQIVAGKLWTHLLET